jgi:hypothetical protein
MVPNVRNSAEPSVTSLVGDVVQGVQELVRQQLDLLRLEFQDDVRKIKEFAFSLTAGLGVILVGGVLLCMALALLLHFLMPALPLWVCYGIVAIALGGAGGTLLYAGIKKLSTVHTLPGQPTEAIKENARWRTNPK